MIKKSQIPLSPRETDVERCMLMGLRMAEIAEELGLSINTIKTHIKRIFKKRCVGGHIELIMKTLKERGCKCLG